MQLVLLCQRQKWRTHIRIQSKGALDRPLNIESMRVARRRQIYSYAILTTGRFVPQQFKHQSNWIELRRWALAKRHCAA